MAVLYHLFAMYVGLLWYYNFFFLIEKYFCDCFFILFICIYLFLYIYFYFLYYFYNWNLKKRSSQAQANSYNWGYTPSELGP